jgi:nucleoside-diphosphate-sugar epimerase
MSTRVVITGAGGFIGKSIVSRLRENKDLEVVSVSRKTQEGFCKVADYSDSPNGDLLIHLGEENTLSKVDKHEVEKAEETITSLTKKGRYKHIIYASSGVLYGESSEAKHKTTDPIIVNNHYSALKFNSERAVRNSDSGLIARLSNIIGPGMASSSVVKEIISQLSSGSNIKLHNLSPVRDFLWVEDTAECFSKMAYSLLNQKTTDSVLNVSSGVGTSIESLAKMFIEHSKSPKGQVTGENIMSKSSTIILDNNETLIQLGWEPKVTLAQAVAIMCELPSKINK